MPTKEVTHKLENNYITEVLPQEREFWTSQLAPQPVGLALGGGGPRTFGSEGQKSLRAEAQGLGKPKTLLLEGYTQGFMCTGTWGKAVSS